MGMGRPSDYTPELAKSICQAIATSSKGLRRLCVDNEDFPSVTTIMNWLNNPNHKDFVEQYARAREAQADYLADEIIEISDDEKGDEAEFIGANHVNRDKLRVDARKWKASKLAPKKYGDKLDVTSANEKINTLNLTSITEEQLRKIKDELLQGGTTESDSN